jgi:hypothetical protein
MPPVLGSRCIPAIYKIISDTKDTVARLYSTRKSSLGVRDHIRNFLRLLNGPIELEC